MSREQDQFDFAKQTEDIEHIAEETPEQRFRRFHEANPHVYRAIVHLARENKRDGWRKGSIWLIFGQLRWMYAIQTKGDTFRLNNNLTPFYSRLVMEREADLEGFFEIRARRGEEAA